MNKTALIFAVVWLACARAFAGDFASEKLQNWHQWRGPNANGVAPLADPPLEWSEDKNVRWKAEIPGRGNASPIVWNDRVFLLTAIKTDKKGPKAAATASAAEPPSERQRQRGRRRGRFGRAAPPTNVYRFAVICLDRKSGNTLWQKTAVQEVPHEPGHRTNTFASASPTTDGRSVYASFGSRGIYCFDMDGNLRWERDLGDMQTRNGFGEGSSPTIHGETLIVNWDHEGQSFIVALNARTGQPRWKVQRDERTTWATPLVVDRDGRAQVITNGSNRVRSYDLETGQLLWECGGQASNPIPSPLTHRGVVYCMTGYRGYAIYAISLDATGDVTNTEKVAWHRTDTGPYIASPVLLDGLLYVTKSRSAILSCLDAASGETVYGPQRLPGLDTLYASPVAAAGRLYFVDRNGTALVLRHGRRFEVLATNRLDEGIDASPAVVGRQILLRGEKHLYCIE